MTHTVLERIAVALETIARKLPEPEPPWICIGCGTANPEQHSSQCSLTASLGDFKMRMRNWKQT
jgi:hypothetical protein